MIKVQVRPDLTLLREDVQDGRAAVVYVMDDFWRVTLGVDVRAPWDGAGSMTVELDLDADNVEAAVATYAETGLTAELLRRIPLGDARVRLRRLRAVARLSEDPRVAGLSKRFTTEEQWAEFAHLYGQIVAWGVKHPLATLAEVSGISQTNLAGRARWARDRGYLSSPSKTSLGGPTAKARRIRSARTQTTTTREEGTN